MIDVQGLKPKDYRSHFTLYDFLTTPLALKKSAIV